MKKYLILATWMMCFIIPTINAQSSYYLSQYNRIYYYHGDDSFSPPDGITNCYEDGSLKTKYIQIIGHDDVRFYYEVILGLGTRHNFDRLSVFGAKFHVDEETTTHVILSDNQGNKVKVNKKSESVNIYTPAYDRLPVEMKDFFDQSFYEPLKK